MKKLNSKHIKTISVVLLVIGLVISGMVGTLQYQSFISTTEDRGAFKYKEMNCDSFSNEDKSATWLECEVTKAE